MGIAWDKAIEIFKTEHPGVTVDFERKAFEQIQQNAGMIISSDEGPDIMEYNKGNATAGLLASQGLLTNLTDQATARGWDKELSPSLQTTAKYDSKGVMGSGDWYGVPNYGEYVMVYYNKDAFAAQGLSVPTTLPEFTAAMDKFVAAGTTPLCMAGAEYPAGQLAYQLALTKADRSFVDDYQLYKNPVDFQSDPLKYGADTFDAWVKAGYISQDSASLKAEDMGTGFIGGKCPMIVSGSWWFGRFADEIKGFDWGTFTFPGSQLSLGSSGNIWVVPEASKNKDLAYDFIDITMRPEIQELIGNSGGIPVAADPSKITDPKNAGTHRQLQQDHGGRRPGVLPGLARARLLRRAGVRIPVADQPVQDARRGAGPDLGPVPRGRCDHPGRLTRFHGPTKWRGPAALYEPPARPILRA